MTERRDYRPRCKHGVLRATPQFDTYAGPVAECECCRSPFGYLGDPQTLCEGCR